jgi:hypothetical protein
LPDDPRVQEWAAHHADPEPEDGLSAVIPNACIDSVRAFVEELGSREDEDELIELSLEGAYETIGLVLRSTDVDAMEALVEPLVGLPRSWENPVARPEILEFVRAAGLEEPKQPS